MEIRLTTTGTLNPAPIESLGKIPGYSHPTTDYNLLNEFNFSELQEKEVTEELNLLVSNGYITLKDENGNNVDMSESTHTHQNKTLLDAYDQTNTNITDAVNKKHTQNTDTILDQGGANEVSALQAKTAYTHSQSTHAPADAEKNVNADWNASSGDAEILNKPTSFPVSVHAPSHTDGTDDIQSATNTQKGLMTSSQVQDLENEVEIHSNTHEPTGFVNRTDSTISFVNSTRVFTIAPASSSYDFYIEGEKYTKSSSLTTTITDTEGLWFIYFDSSGNIQSSQTWNDNFILQNSLISIIYWDATNNKQVYFADERHGITMDGATHLHWHNSIGTNWYNVMSLSSIVSDGDGSSATYMQFGYSAGKIADEDIIFSISSASAPASIPIYYKSGANGDWREKTADSYPIIYSGTAGYSGTRVPYNEWTGSTWQLTEITNGDFLVMLYFATNDVSRPVVGVQGQNIYTTVGTARDGIKTELESMIADGLPFVEFAPLGGVIVQTRSNYTNTPYARIRTLDDGSDYLDLTGLLGASRGAVSISGPVKEIFIRDMAYGSYKSKYKTMRILDAGTNRLNFNVPFDFNSLVSIAVVLIPIGTDTTAYIDFDVEFAKLGEPYDQHAVTDTTSTYPLVANEINEIDITSLFTDLNANDRVGMKMTNNYGATLHILTVRLRYK